MLKVIRSVGYFFQCLLACIHVRMIAVQFVWLQLLFGTSFICTYAHDDMISCGKQNVISLQYTV